VKNVTPIKSTLIKSKPRLPSDVWGTLIIAAIRLGFYIWFSILAVENIMNSLFGFFIPGWVAFVVGLVLGSAAIPISVVFWALHFTAIHFPLMPQHVG
jgi:hypothetical protein